MLAALERELGGRGDLEPSPRAATSSGSTCPATRAELLARAEAAGVTFVKGADFFPDGARRLALGPARVQLRVALGDRRGRLDARLAPRAPDGAGGAARAARRRRARRGARAGSPRSARSRLAEDEVDRRLLVVADDERDQVGADQDRARPSRIQSRGCQLLVELVARATPWREAYAAAKPGAAAGTGTRRGCRGGSSAPAVARRNVGHGVSPGRAHRPARRK